MSRTITSFSGSFGSLTRLASSSRRALPLPMCGCQAGGSAAVPVITTLIAPASSSSLCQSGRSFDDVRCRAPRRCAGSCRPSSPCRPSPPADPRNAAPGPRRPCAIRFSDPTSASTLAHLRLSRSCSVVASSSVSSSISASIFGFSSSSAARSAPAGSRSRSAPSRRPPPRADVVNVDVSPKTAGVLTSSFSMGVPVKPMKEAFGRASRRYLAKP